jgi:transglutaminase-like putative cysteine protease
MKLRVLHRTHYHYATPVRESFNEARLKPVDASPQVCDNFLLRVLPTARLSHYLDFHRNWVHVFEVPQPHSVLQVEATSTVTTCDQPRLAADATPAPLAGIGACIRQDRCYDFLQNSAFVGLSADVWRLALDATDGQTDAWQASRSIMGFINREFRYDPTSTHVHTHMSESLKLRSGVCQDFAHVMLGMCRSLKIPARYVSGYLYNGPAEHLKGAQASHAWIEVYIPGTGWVGLDPTNNRSTDGHYIKVANGRDYTDVPPMKGTYRGTGARKLNVEVLVTRIEDDPVGAP